MKAEISVTMDVFAEDHAALGKVVDRITRFVKDECNPTMSVKLRSPHALEVRYETSD